MTTDSNDGANIDAEEFLVQEFIDLSNASAANSAGLAECETKARQIECLFDYIVEHFSHAAAMGIVLRACQTMGHAITPVTSSLLEKMGIRP